MQPDITIPKQPVHKHYKLRLVLISIGIILGTAGLFVGGALLWQSLSKPQTATIAGPSIGYVTSLQAAVAWEQVADASEYTLECAGDEQFGGRVASVTTTTPNGICGNLSAGTQYWARVRAVTPTGTTEWSKPTMFKTVGSVASPTSIKANPLSDTEIQLSWESVGSLSSYDVQWATDQSFTTDTTNITSSSTTVTLTELKPDTTYYIRVRAQNTDNPLAIVPFSDFVTTKTQR